MDDNLERRKIINGLVWNTLERGGALGIQFIVQIILARLLLPEQYGIVALVIILINIGDVFIQSGFTSSLIQKKEADDIDFSSVFFLSSVTAVIIYIFLYLLSPAIANFYRQPELVEIIRVMSITLFFGVVSSIETAILTKKLDFKLLFFSSFSSVLISGIVGIVLAYKGYGVWALVFQQISNKFVLALSLVLIVKWKPKLIFSFNRIKFLFSYGWKIMVSGLLETAFNNIYSLVIGRTYDSQTLGYYSRGEQFPKYFVILINGSISSVLFPAMSNIQGDKLKIKNIVRRSIMTSSFIILPAMFGLAATSESLIRVLLTDKWIDSKFFMQVLCVSYAFWPIHTANLQAIKALGHSEIFLKLEIVKKIIGLIVLAISVPHGIYVMVLFKPITSIIGTFLNSFPNKKLFNYSFIEQWRDIIPTLVLSISMGLIISRFTSFGFTPLLTLILQIIVGVAIYIAGAIIFKIESYEYVKDVIKTYVKK